VSHPKQGDLDLDEDLFDFGGVGPEPDPSASEENLEEIFATFRAEAASKEPEAPEIVSAPPAPAAPAPRTPEAPAPRPSRSPTTAPTSAAQGAPAPASVAAPAAESVLVPAPRVTRYSKGLVAIALSVTVLNASLAVVLLRSNSDRHDVRAIEEGPNHAAGSAQPAPAPRVVSQADPLPDPDSVTPTHGHPTLDEAREELARGDHAAARRRVYGLLAIVDRLEDPRKSELEAECQYLIAQSLHLEALARMGGQQ